MIVEHLRESQLEYELDKCDERRDPPVPVNAWLLLDGRRHDGELLGWGQNPNGGDPDDSWRGLLLIVREFAPGFSAEGLHWVRSEDVAQR